MCRAITVRLTRIPFGRRNKYRIPRVIVLPRLQLFTTAVPSFKNVELNSWLSHGNSNFVVLFLLLLFLKHHRVPVTVFVTMTVGIRSWLTLYGLSACVRFGSY